MKNSSFLKCRKRVVEMFNNFFLAWGGGCVDYWTQNIWNLSFYTEYTLYYNTKLHNSITICWSKFIRSPKRSLETLFLYSFSPLNLSIAFLGRGWTELCKNLWYDRPAYLVVHYVLNFFNWGWSIIFWGVQMGVESNIESYGNNFTLYCK